MEGADIPTNEFTEVPLQKKKVPRRQVYFSDGYLDEYSTDEEVEECATASLVDTSTLPWMPYLWHMTWWVGTKALAVCDYLGEHLANFLGITTPKFQYEIEQYKKMIEEEEALKAKIAAENAGWSEKEQDEVLLCPASNGPYPTKVTIDTDGQENSKESKASLFESDSQKWQRY